MPFISVHFYRVSHLAWVPLFLFLSILSLFPLMLCALQVIINFHIEIQIDTLKHLGISHLLTNNTILQKRKLKMRKV